MKTFFRRLASAVPLFAAVLAVPVAFATPTISITSPTNGSTIATASTPAGVTISVTTAIGTSTAGSLVSSVNFLVNGTSIGVVGGGSFGTYSTTWTPTAPGTYSLTATVTDTSVPTSGTTPNLNAATSPVVTVNVSATRVVTLLSPASNSVYAQGSEIFFRATAAMSDAVVSQVEFFVDGNPFPTRAVKTQVPYNLALALTAANGFTPGSHVIRADALSSDNVTVSSTNTTISIGTAISGNTAPVVTLTAPSASSFVPVNQNVTVTATATDDGFIPSSAGAGVTFYVDGDPITPSGTGETNPDLLAPYSVTWRPTVAKVYSLRALAVDDKGVYALSSAISVTAVATLPTVSLTAGTTATVGTATTLSASATASPGATVTKVEFLENGTIIGTDTTAPYTFSWTPTTVGTSVITARVTDSANVVVNSTAVSVTVSVALPTVTISASSSVSVNTATTLTATATAPTGATVTQVQFLSGATVLGTGTLSSGQYTLSWTPTTTGSFSLTARVTDSNGNSVTSSAATVTVAAAVPTVSITSPTNGTAVPLGTSVNLVASATGNGGATVNRIDFLAGTTVVGTALPPANSFSWTPTATGIFALSARATDTNGATSTSTIVNVNVTGPSVALSAPTAGTTVTSGTAVTLTASTTVVAPATVTKVEFFAGSTLAGTATASPYSVDWTPSTSGSTSLTARITDSNGATATSSAVVVTVGAPAAPTVSVSAPSAGAVVTVGSSVSLTANATAGAGATIAQVQFLVGTTIVGTDTTAPYSVTWVPPTAGNFSITAKVIDSNNATVTSSAVSVTANAATSISLTAPTNNSTATVGTAIAVTASPAPSLGNTVTSVTFFAGATQIGAAVTSAPYTIAWTPSTAGTTSLTAQVLDSAGVTATSAAISVSVANSAPTVAITAPLAGALVTAGSNVTVTATANGGSGGATVSQVQFLAGTTVIATLAGTTGSSTYSTTWIPAVAGNFSLTARVTDSNGNTTTSTAVSVTATAAAAPTVSISAPLAGSVVTAGSTVTVSASATPGAGATVSQVQFFLGGTTLIGSSTTAVGGLYSISWVPSAAGSFSLTARVVDSASNSVTSNAVAVTAVAATSVALTSPANNSTATVSTPVTITASAAPIAGATITRVNFLVNGTAIAGSPVTTAPYTLAWTPTTAGTATLTVQAVDSLGTTVTSSAVTVTVSNSAPTISLTAPLAGAVVTAGSATPLTATAVAGSGGATVSQVQFLAGTTVLATLSGTPGSSTYTTSWTPAAAGNFSLTARVTDSNGNSTTSTAISVTALAAASPSAIVTAPSTGSIITVGSVVTISATASPGAGATVAQVQFLSGGTTVLGTTTTTTSPGVYSILWSPSSAANFSITARVLDTAGNTGTSAAVTVTSVAATSVSLTAPANASTATVGTATTVSASAAPIAGATISRVNFFAGTAAIGTSTTAPYSISWTPTAAGVANLTAQAVDSTGTTATSAVVSVTVSNSAPTATLTAPLAGSVSTAGSVVTLTANATPGSGGATVTQVQFLAGNTTVATLAGTPASAIYSTPWTPAAAGNFPLTVRVTDSNGNTTTSTVVTVTVNSAATPTITLTAPTPGSLAAVGSAVTVTATATPGAGATISQVQFNVGNTIIATVAGNGGTTYTTTWTPTTAGNFNLTARVIDSTNATVTSTAIPVTVSAAAASTVAVTSPTAGATLPLATETTLSVNFTTATGITVNRVDYLVNGLVVATGIASPYDGKWTPSTSGVITVTARLTDSAGTVVTSAPVIASVSTTAGSSVSLSIAPAGVGVPANSARTLTAIPVSAVGIARVEFLYDGVAFATDTTAPYSAVFSAPVELGTHRLQARAVEITGTEVLSAVTSINITAPVGVSPLVSILSPTNGAFVAAGTPVTVTGTASDADGAVTSVQVYVNGATTGLANGGLATLNGSSWTIIWTPAASGTASVTAIAADNNGNTVAAPAVGVNVTDNTSPTITLSLSPRTSSAAASATLPSGAVRNFVADVNPSSGRAVVRVEFFVDGTKVGEDTTVPYTFRYIAPALLANEPSRTVVLSARAMDNAGAARDVQLPLLVVAPLGQPPVVNLLTPTNGTSVFPNTSVSLAATAVANGGTIASVQFYVNGNPAAVNGGNALTSAPFTASFVPPIPGNYTIDVIATDDRGNTTVSNSATFTAAFATPTVVFTSPNPNATARATPGVPFTLAATATVQSGTGAAILLVEFLLDGVQIGADTTPPYSFSWMPTTAQLGQHFLTARVTDTNSQTSVSNPVAINVANVIGSPPTVSVTASPIPAPFGIQTASTVNFVATAVATGTNANLNNVEIYLNDISIGLGAREQNTNFYRVAYDLTRFDFTSVTPIINDFSGAVTYPVRLYAIARDTNNNQTVSATTNLTINPATSSPPAIQLFAATPTNVTAGTQFFMFSNFSDLDGVVTLIQLYANGTLVANFGNPQQGQFLTYNAANAGRFNLYAVATDDTGNTAVSSPSIVVNVTAVNAPNTTLTRPFDDNSTATVGSPVFLEGTAVNTSTTQVPFVQFIATAAGGSRQVINGIRVGNTSVFRAIWTPTNPDTYTVSTQASVGQVQGTSPTSRRVVVTEVLGLAPSISLTRSPGVSGFPNFATTASSADLAATATDPDGSIVDVEFFLNRNSVGKARKDPQGNTWRITASFAGLQPGGTEVVALARDNSGNIVASTTNNINVVAASSIAPSITVTPSTTNPAFNRAVTLRVNARDSDGTVNQVQYFANATSIATSNNSGSLFLSTWTPTLSGTYYIWAVATDNSGNSTVSPTIEMNVRRNNPVLENSAFILQSYQDIANTTNINPLVFDQLDEQLANGSLTRADILVSPLTANGGLPLTDLPGFQAPINLLATYYVLMGQWPTPQNYATFLATARFSLPQTVTQILNANEYFAKYGFVPTNQLLDNPNSAVTAESFLNRLYDSAGLRPPEPLDRVTFRSNNVLSATRGRGYNVVGLQQAIAEFVTNTNSTNTALFAKARAAALYYQLARPPVTMTVDDITARIDAFLKLPSQTDLANAVLKDIYYGYRFVTITKQPQSLVVAPRSGVILSVEAQGAPPLVYQWLLNGAPVAGATNSFLSFTNADTSRVGNYTVAITSAAATDTSDVATLTLSSEPTRLANISTRGVTTGGSNVLIGGFVVTGANQQQTRQMLIRVVGPTLTGAPFNVAGALANPRLEVYAGGSATPVLTNDDWGTQAGGAAQVTAIQQAMTRAGAFSFSNANSADAAVLATLPPGPYTIQAKGPANNDTASGVVLIEVYDVTVGGVVGPKAVNVSTRGNVGTGTNILIAGFVVNGTVSRRVLIRGAGPALTRLGVPGVLADPQLTLIEQSSGRTIKVNDDWATGDDASVIADAAATAGAFPFASGSKDSAMIVMLPPGAYTAQLKGANNGTGVGIVEVYDVDP